MGLQCEYCVYVSMGGGGGGGRNTILIYYYYGILLLLNITLYIVTTRVALVMSVYSNFLPWDLDLPWRDPGCCLMGKQLRHSRAVRRT